MRRRLNLKRREAAANEALHSLTGTGSGSTHSHRQTYIHTYLNTNPRQLGSLTCPAKRIPADAAEKRQKPCKAKQRGRRKGRRSSSRRSSNMQNAVHSACVNSRATLHCKAVCNCGLWVVWIVCPVRQGQAAWAWERARE